MGISDILKVCPGATKENTHTLIEVIPGSNRWFCRNGDCKLAYLIIDKNEHEEIVWVNKHNE